MDAPRSPARLAAALEERWSPRVVAELEDVYVKVAKVEGALVWHRHEDEDELFYVLKGRLRLELEGRDAVELAEGDIFVVPKGLNHLPVAEAECHLLLIERKSTKHTGDTATALARSLAEQLRPL